MRRGQLLEAFGFVVITSAGFAIILGVVGLAIAAFVFKTFAVSIVAATGAVLGLALAAVAVLNYFRRKVPIRQLALTLGIAFLLVASGFLTSAISNVTGWSMQIVP